MKLIRQVFNHKGKEYNINSLKYGIKPNMILLLQNDEFYHCTGNESIISPTEYDCTGIVKLNPSYYLNS